MLDVHTSKRTAPKFQFATQAHDHVWIAWQTAGSGDGAELFKWLLPKGIDTGDQRGQTPSHRVAENGCLKAVKLLVNEAKADVELKDSGTDAAELGGHERPSGSCEVWKLVLTSSRRTAVRLIRLADGRR